MVSKEVEYRSGMMELLCGICCVLFARKIEVREKREKQWMKIERDVDRVREEVKGYSREITLSSSIEEKGVKSHKQKWAKRR